MAVRAIALATLAIVATATDVAPAVSLTNVTAKRQLASAGCDACCFQNDCRLAFTQSAPGVCCGAHRTRGQTGCCPMGATCVACQNIWKCSRSTYITRSGRCSICRDDMPPECMYRRGYGHGYHSGGSMFSALFLLIGLCAIAACVFGGRGGMCQDEVVVVQQPGMMMQNGQYVQGGQPMVVQGGCGCARLSLSPLPPTPTSLSPPFALLPLFPLCPLSPPLSVPSARPFLAPLTTRHLTRN